MGSKFLRTGYERRQDAEAKAKTEDPTQKINREVQMVRNTGLRQQIVEPNPKQMAYPFAYVNDEFTIEDIQVPVINERPLFDAGKFPDNIKKFYWIRQGRDGLKPWYALVKLRNNHYAFYKASSCTTGFGDGGSMSLKVCPFYDLIIKYAMTEDEYSMYMKDTL
jgi:hypothetical protein